MECTKCHTENDTVMLCGGHNYDKCDLAYCNNCRKNNNWNECTWMLCDYGAYCPEHGLICINYDECNQSFCNSCIESSLEVTWYKCDNCNEDCCHDKRMYKKCSSSCIMCESRVCINCNRMCGSCKTEGCPGCVDKNYGCNYCLDFQDD